MHTYGSLLKGATSILNRLCGVSYQPLIWFLSTRSCPLPFGDGFKSIGALPFTGPGSVVDVWTNDIVGNLPQEMNEF